MKIRSAFFFVLLSITVLDLLKMDDIRSLLTAADAISNVGFMERGQCLHGKNSTANTLHKTHTVIESSEELYWKHSC